MKVLCPACERLGELESFRLDGPRLLATCARCGVESAVEVKAPPAAEAPSAPPSPAAVGAPRPLPFSSSPAASNVVTLRTPHLAAVEKAAEAAQVDPFAAPEGLCPRCLSPKGRGESCPACGVAFAQATPATLAPAPWLAEAWRELLQAWGDEARHEALRRLAFEREELAALGRLYRLRLGWAPDDPFALQGRDEVLRLALVPVALRREEAPRTGAAWKTALVAAVALAVAVALLALVRQLFKSAAGDFP